MIHDPASPEGPDVSQRRCCGHVHPGGDLGSDPGQREEGRGGGLAFNLSRFPGLGLANKEERMNEILLVIVLFILNVFCH